MITAIYILNIALIASLVLDLRVKGIDRRLSMGWVRILMILTLLVVSYFSANFFPAYYAAPIFFISENTSALLFMVLAIRFYQVSSSNKSSSFPIHTLFLTGSLVVLTVAGYTYFQPSLGEIVDDVLVFRHYGLIYISAFLLLIGILLLSWRLEAFWRTLDTGDKWRYKYLVVGLFLVCAMLGWSSSYRLAYLRIPKDHLLLLAIIIIIALLLMVFALARHRLLNRKLFVSRKVVYATITPIVFSGFFILVGFIALLSRLYSWSVPFVLQWIVFVLGILGISVFALSGSVRSHVKYFISTHFYVNKYEYRDEWLALSDLLQGKLTEKGIAEAVYQILRDSLYTDTILIWLGDTQKGFRLINYPDDKARYNGEIIPGDDTLVLYLHKKPYIYSRQANADPLRRTVLLEKEGFLKAHDIVLMVPMFLGEYCVGLIGLGPETTGGRYGQDDFDLLAALSSHTASALLAVQNAEKLARTREQSVWNNLSAFVLHDIKNAATMLDLVRKNAPHHIDNPMFQQDMLESIDDALRRMAKVQTRLSALKEEMVPDIRPLEVRELLWECRDKLAKKLSDLEITSECPPDLSLRTDPDFFHKILENLLINAREAGGGGTAVRIKVTADSMIRIDLQDNGPGIQADLLPRALFEPFKTAKPNGSGIGLWQVRRLVDSLGGDIQAQNNPEGGARFTLRFPNRPRMRINVTGKRTRENQKPGKVNHSLRRAPRS